MIKTLMVLFAGGATGASAICGPRGGTDVASMPFM
jgi:hypothetical protein